MSLRFLLQLALVGLGLGTIGCGAQSSNGTGGPVANADKPTVGYVTNMVASFWVIAQKGAQDGAKQYDVNVEVRMPPDGTEVEQKRMVQDLLARGIDGIAISPIHAENQLDLLAEIARHTHLITQDSDAPKSDRLCYVGMDNYTAGRMCGELVKQAMPDGGSVMIFVGRLGQLNARQRRQGVIDELLDRDPDPNRYDPPGTDIPSGKYVILDTRTDDGDPSRARSNAEDAIAAYPDLGCMVGLFAYNPPQCLEAVRDADKIGKIQLVGFDEDADTLQGIVDGDVIGTVVQNPYEYGHESVRILAGLARGDRSVLPEGGFLNIPARKITRENVETFWAELKQRMGE
jgi:ribose transport system substrate-binding protein